MHGQLQLMDVQRMMQYMFPKVQPLQFLRDLMIHFAVPAVRSCLQERLQVASFQGPELLVGILIHYMEHRIFIINIPMLQVVRVMIPLQSL